MARMLRHRSVGGLVVLAFALAACGAGLPRLTPVPGLPTGWRSVSYGAVRVAVPPGWTVIGKDRVPICSLPPPHSVVVGTYDQIEATSCPSIQGEPGLTYVFLFCETGSAARIYSRTTPTTEVGAATLREDGPDVWYLAVGPTVTELSVHVPAEDTSLLQRIMSTVATTGQGC